MSFFRAFLAGGLFALPLFAQTPTGRITGRVTDSSGAVVQRANVKTRNILTNVETATMSTSEGIFDLLNLIPGQYRLEVEISGFKRYQQGPLELRVGDSLTVDVMLQVGSQAESVTVNAEAALIESASATSGRVVDTRRLENLPLPASNPLVTTLMVANMTMLTSPTSTYTPDANTQVVNAAAAGTRQGQSLQAIDGMPSMQGGNAAGIVPTPEILQEVKVSTSPYDASQGHFTGALVNMVTKSGTNGFHGSLVFWNTNTSMNALNYFSKRSINEPSTGPVTHAKIRSIVPYISFNRYRGNGGGPLVIPGIYNGRNRTFWQYAGDYFFMPYSSNGLFTVPTAKQRDGDFSDLLAVGSQFQIYDPYSATPTADGHVSRRPLAGNRIPQNQLSLVAQKLLQYWPAPNLPGTNTGLQNYTGVPNSSIDMAQRFGRVDQVIGANNRMFVSYNRYCLYAIQNITFGQRLNTTPTGGIQANCHQGGTIDDVITPAPNWVLDFRYGFVRFQAYRPHTSLGFDLSSLGMSTQLVSDVDKQKATLPQLNIDNITGIGGASGSNAGQMYHNVFASATHIRGSHSVKFGVEFRTTQITGSTWGNITPAYDFRANWTTATDTSAASPMGQGLASFLYGLPTGGSISRNDSSASTSKMFSWYIHDDWRATKKLTVNVGFRHELEYPVTERYNRANRGFDVVTANPTEAAARANYARNPIPQIPADQFRVTGGQLFVTPSNRGIYQLNARNFMPRIGLSYQLTPTTVVRTGYGIFFESYAADFVSVTQNGYSQSTAMVPSVDNGLTFQVNLQNYPFPGGILNPTRDSAGLKTFLGRAISFVTPNNRQGYAQRWTFNIQRQFGQRILLEVGYTGNRGTRLNVNNDPVNSIPIQYLSRSPFRDQATINMLSAQVPSPFFGISDYATTAHANPTIGVSQLLRPYPQFTDVTFNNGIGLSWYHAMSVQVEKRFSHGFTMQGDYTWSKFMEATSRLNGTQSPLEHAISSFDRPHQFAANGIFELPFGKTKPWLHALPGWADRVVAGWQVQAIYIAQTGSPMEFPNVLFLGNLHDIVLPKSERTIQRYFNTGAGFNTVASQQLASNYRTFPSRLTGARNPGWNLWAMSVIKRVPVKEKINFELRAEAKNALNHPNWNPLGANNLNPTNALFGQITGAQGGRQITLQGKLNW